MICLIAAVSVFSPNLGPGESITVTPAEWPPLLPSAFPQAPNVGFHEFQVDCAVNQVAPTDPIVHPGAPGVSHSHTFVGAKGETPYSTIASEQAAGTTCTTVADTSSYWFPTMYIGAGCPTTGMIFAPSAGCTPVLPKGNQIIYYKAGISNYNTIRAFPDGLRFVVGSATATPAQFQAGSGTTGWACGNSDKNWVLPASCPAGSNLLVRYQAPSCWDGINLDTPDHQSHMAYPVKGVCPADHPVALPMLEFKISYPVGGMNLSTLRLSSGGGSTWHADFFSAWGLPTEEALVTQCINGGGQCDARGFDQHKPERGTVLNTAYELP